MKKILLFSLIFTLLSASVFSQKIEDVFKTMPDALLPGLSEGNKTMLLLDNGEGVSLNDLGEIKKLNHTNDYLKIETSPIGNTQIKLLSLINETQIICVVRTVCAQACDSNIRFYTIDWKELDANSLLPELNESFFFNFQESVSDFNKVALSLPDIYPISAEFVNGSNDLTIKLDLEKYMSAEHFSNLKPYMKGESIILKWNRTSFK